MRQSPRSSSLRRQLQHLALSRRKGFVRIERAGIGLLNLGINGDPRHRRTEETSARGRLSHGTNQILLSGVFQDVADRAVPERLGNEGTTAVHR